MVTQGYCRVKLWTLSCTSEPATIGGMTTDNPTMPPSEKPKKSGAMRAIKWIVLSIIVLVVIVVAGVLLKLDEIVRRTVETQASSSLNVQTTLKSASVSLLGGSVKLGDLDINAPAGFKTPRMLSLGGIGVGVKVSELRDEPIKISTIDITDPKMVIEMSGTDFNIKKFMDGLPPSQAEPMKLVIGTLNVTGAQVTLRPDLAALSAVPGLGKNLSALKQEYTISIPPLKLENIGTADGNQNGAAIKEVVSLLITQLAAKASQSDQLPPELRQVLSLNVNDIMGSLKANLGAQVQGQLSTISGDMTKNLPPDTAKALQGVLQNPSDAANNPQQTIEQGLGGLLSGKDKSKSKKASTQPSK